MKIFISWSGDRSGKIASVLRDWLETVLPYAKPWISTEDIKKGTVWFKELSKELDETSFGIICCVPENIKEPWIQFEAGTANRPNRKVATFLLGLTTDELEKNPLSHFNATVFKREDVLRLVQSINGDSQNPLTNDLVKKKFDVCWPGLEQKINEVLDSDIPQKSSLSNQGKQKTFLNELEVKIIQLLANSPDWEPEVNDLASSLNVHPTKTEYLLKRLEDNRLVDRAWAMGSCSYHLSDDGRAYAVENNLLV